ncbi:MAG TPA: hypothetical protein VNM14_24290 [Planctomycetota bacterium]|nr:hypothetical protein [Planctomycetota bacterium]
MTRKRIGSALVALSLLTGCATSPAIAPLPQPKMIISRGGGGWKDGQVNEPIILVNPKDPSRLVMFYSGMKLGGNGGAIGKAWATATDPFTWHEDEGNPVLVNETASPARDVGVRLDSVLYDAGSNEYWIYYTTYGAADSISLAICPAGADGYSGVLRSNIRRHPGNPILSPRGQGRDDETHVSQASVLRENGLWSMLYSYRSSPKNVLPGIRLATSPDGKRWTKVPGPDLLSAAPEQKYIEWHSTIRVGNRYVMLFEGYNGGTRWGADVAVSDRLSSGWKKLPTMLLDQTTWPGYSDASMFHVATPAIYNWGGRWYLYVQAAPAGYYINQPWSLWAVDCDDALAPYLRS